MLLHLSECKEEALRAVLGASDEARDPVAIQCCEDTFYRSLYFAPALRPLRGLVTPIATGAAQLSTKLTQLPGKASLKQALEGKEPLSLRAIMVIVMAIRAIIAEEPRSESVRQLVEVLKRLFPDPDVVPAGSVIPSYYAVDLAFIEKVQKEIRPDVDHHNFSAELLAGQLKNANKERYFLEHLIKGFQREGHAERGVYKITASTAQLLYDRLKALVGGDQFPSFEAFAWPDAQTGPRAGQVSSGLPPALGNLL